MLQIKQIPLGAFQANCYIIIDKESKNCFLIDPGAQGDVLIHYLEKEKIKPQFILLTHGHIDHIGAVEEITNYAHLPVYIGQKEKIILDDQTANLSSFAKSNVSFDIDHYLIEGDEIEFCGKKIKSIETPGHTIGGMTYVLDNYLFTGDTLFQGSIGRTDFPTGDYDMIMQSIVSKILVYPEDDIVLSGHGPSSTVKFEKSHNPFVISYQRS